MILWFQEETVLDSTSQEEGTTRWILGNTLKVLNGVYRDVKMDHSYSTTEFSGGHHIPEPTVL